MTRLLTCVEVNDHAISLYKSMRDIIELNAVDNLLFWLNNLCFKIGQTCIMMSLWVLDIIIT